jgi:predicted dehydrogenase
LGDLLSRDDIKAVVVCLPILTQPAVILEALSAGKHVLSEKPVAKNIVTAKGLIDRHAAQHNALIWGVAENFRFFEPIVVGAERVKEIGGQLVTFNMKMFLFINDENKYFNTDCKLHPLFESISCF